MTRTVKQRQRQEKTTSPATRIPGLALLLLLHATLCLNDVSAFPVDICSSSSKVQYRTFKLFAKPPPTSTTDMAAIVALEKELDAQSSSFGSNKDNTNEVEWNDILLEDEGEEAKIYEVTPEWHNKRIEFIISALEPEMSRTHCGNLVSGGRVAISTGSKLKVVTRKSVKLEKGTIIHVRHAIDEKSIDIVAQNLPLDILYEDGCMIVLNKAAGMVVHPAAGNWNGTVVNALSFYLANVSSYGCGEFIGFNEKASNQVCAEVGLDRAEKKFRPGIVHRLDKGTTGIFVIAKTGAALAGLSEAFATRQVKKTYIAISVGNPGKQVVIDKPIGRHPINRQKMRVVPDPSQRNSSGRTQNEKLGTKGAARSAAQAGRRALSFVDTLAFDGTLSVVRVRIETGRTHQIRVHLQDRHTPIYGDDIYGLSDWNKRLRTRYGIERPLLHAFQLEIAHPISGQKMVLVAPMAKDMAMIADTIWPQGREEHPNLFDRPIQGDSISTTSIKY